MSSPFSHFLGRAIAIAAAAHEQQYSRSGHPYILHPLRMMMQGNTVEEQIVAVLHDVVEHSDWTIEQLEQNGFPSNIVTAVEHLTRRSGEPYEQFIERILTDPLATRVKRYDLEDNMSITRLESLSESDWERMQRYHAAYQRVLQALEAQRREEHLQIS